VCADHVLLIAITRLRLAITFLGLVFEFETPRTVHGADIAVTVYLSLWGS